MATWPKRNLHKCEYLVSIGVDPKSVREDGWGSDGYNALVLDAKGKKIIINGAAQFKRVDWRSLEEYQGFYEAYRKDIGR